jgi:hypothetical protein
MMREGTLDGKKIAWNDDPENGNTFRVEVGKGRGKYKTRYTFRGNLAEACKYYRCINIGLGYKKRLVCPEFNKPTLARAFS